jgi:formylglycine-generating enzyme required for sulfatase activity
MRVGDYELLAEIGRGGMGIVYRARSRDGRDVAVKVLIAGGAEAVARFAREQRLLASLGEAEGFVPLLDHGAEPRPFLVMPFLGGGSLGGRFERGPLAIDEAVALGKTLATSLGLAHARGIVHRDLKPENVLFTDDGRPLVADLGLAKHFRVDVPGASQSAVLTKQGEIRGTWGYMPPEQMRDAKEVGPRADVFALGAILYQALAGARPFEGASMLQLVARVESGQLTPLRRVRGEVPRWLADVVHRALASRADDRFEDGAALARALEDARGPTRIAARVAVAGAVVLAGTVAAALAWPRVGASPKTAPAPAPSRPDPPKVVQPTAAAAPRTGPPAWWSALPTGKRPIWPLPAGVVATERAAQYENAKDRSVLVWVPGRGGVGVSLFIGKYEVSVEQYEAFTRATGYKTFAEQEAAGRVIESRYRPLDQFPRVPGACFRCPDGPARPTDPRWPAVQLTGRDARAYCDWAGLRLPTEEEWLAAAAPTVGSHYPWGDEPRPDLANVEGVADGFKRLAPVDAFPKGESAAGARNMCGNVWELCETSRTSTSVSVLEVVLGGGWLSALTDEADLTHPNNRWQISPAEPNNLVGFRVARDGR